MAEFARDTPHAPALPVKQPVLAVYPIRGWILALV